MLGLLLTSSVPALQRGELSASPASAAPQADAGDLYVANIGSNQVTVHDGESGAFAGVLVAAGGGGLSGATGLAFRPDENLSSARARAT